MSDLLFLRNNVKNFIVNEIVTDVVSGKEVLEFGPMVKSTMKYPDTYVDTRKAFVEKGCIYYSSDIYQSESIDYVTDIHNSNQVINKKVDYIVALDVIEHVKKVWDVPRIMHDLLNIGGKIYISSPYYFRIHGPSPDCWRFTEDGLRDLFEDMFEINKIKPCIIDDEKKPLHYTLIATRMEII